MRYPFASKLIEHIGPSMGIAVELEPEFEFAGELIFPNGKRHLFRNTNLNVNPAGSTEIAKDKGYTSFFLRKKGFFVPESRAFFSDKLNANLLPHQRRGTEAAIAYAESLGLPVFIKPNNLSQGELVTKVYNAGEIFETAKNIFNRTDVLLVERECVGKDYRIVVLGDSIISAYERIPLAITGDGMRTVGDLIEGAQAELQNQGRPNSEINPCDSRIDLKLVRLGLSRASVLPKGQRTFLLDNANLSTGGTSIDVTDAMDSTFAELAIAATKALGLRLSGVDIICADLKIDAKTQVWNIIELNSAPGLDNYASSGGVQANRVDQLYREILVYLSEHGG
ncbi:hypothetical protein [Paraburkholderia sp. RL17-337-BIB-A]|uniref:hypothetical protein n=1 Tax=Paraburkholderia sp. RL17-337-BIB-A TaxID=3031636 RepID=UPI0038B7D71F